MLKKRWSGCCGENHQIVTNTKNMVWAGIMVFSCEKTESGRKCGILGKLLCRMWWSSHKRKSSQVFTSKLVWYSQGNDALSLACRYRVVIIEVLNISNKTPIFVPFVVCIFLPGIWQFTHSFTVFSQDGEGINPIVNTLWNPPYICVHHTTPHTEWHDFMSPIDIRHLQGK